VGVEHRSGKDLHRGYILAELGGMGLHYKFFKFLKDVLLK
jgi:hypothetical protein